MVQADALKRMPRREIKRKATKADRKAERLKVGRLSEQRVSQATAERYAVALHGLSTFVGTPEVELLKRADLESVLCQYVEFLWEEGDPKTMANYVMAAVQYRRPELRRNLKGAWQLVSLWNKLEQPLRATPLSPELVLAFAGTLWQWQWPRLAQLTMVAFCGLLRTGEMFQLKRQDVVLPRKEGQSAILFLRDTKTSQRNFLRSEKVLIPEKSGIACLRALCQRRKPEEKLVDFSPAAFRSLWKEVVPHLGLESFNYVPYSLRRGGATAAYVQGMQFDQLLAKGRWQHIATARLYPDQALQEYTALVLPQAVTRKVRAASQRFAAELGRVEEGARRT